MHYQLDLYSIAHYMHRSAKPFMHVTEVLLSISLHLKCSKFMKFRKRNRSAKAQLDSIFRTAQNLNGLVQRQKLYLCMYYIYLEGFHWVIFQQKKAQYEIFNPS